jgi:hypothetical protein
MVLGFYWNFVETFEGYCERYCDPGPAFAFPLLVILFTICAVFPSLPWILLYGFVIIPNEPYVKFCKDEHMRSIGMGAGHRVRAFLSNETETWECPPKPGSTWVKQSIEKDWQCNETYCTADELASPESCYQATTYMELPYTTWITVWCDNWSADNPGCCQNVYDGTYVECEYCIPDKPILWVISIFAGTATTLACAVAFDYANYKYREVMEKAKKEAEEKAKKDAEEKAQKDTEAAKQGVCSIS